MHHPSHRRAPARGTCVCGRRPTPSSPRPNHLTTHHTPKKNVGPLLLALASLPAASASCGACMYWDPKLTICRPFPFACGGVVGRGSVWDCGDCAGWAWDNELGHCERVGPDYCGRADVASVPPEEFGGDTPPYERGSVLFWRYCWWERSAYDAAQAELKRVAGGGGGGGGDNNGDDQPATQATQGGSSSLPDFPCAQQAEWGKCGEWWMAGKCNRSCGRCDAGDGACKDVRPNGTVE